MKHEGETLTAKEFLKQYEYAARRVKRIEQELNDERLMIDAVRSLSDNDGLPHGTGISKPVEERAIRLADKLAELAQARLDAIEVMRNVFEVIQKVDGVPGDVLFYRYIKLTPRGDLMSWEDVCKSVNYSWGSVHRYHYIGLDAVSKIIE